DNKWLFTEPEKSFLDKLKSMDLIEVEKANTTLQEGIINVKFALDSLPEKATDYKYNYHYLEVGNEDNEHNSVSQIIEKDF
ncbi:MAG TPA: hypothetical protein GX731_04075, partial [Clostridiales bacterium]|nr:hypothetical protein [Clostridiales bacterium]